MKLFPIKACRVCRSKKLRLAGSLGKIAISTFTDKPEQGKLSPMDLMECQECTLVQLRHNVPQELLYTKKYWYRSGLNPVIKANLGKIVKMALNMAKPKPGEIFLDIGANDGTLLSFVPRFLKRIGIEPALNLIEELRQYCTAYATDFWENVDQLPNGEKARIITAIGMFYDSPNPNQFILNVASNLAPNGLFVAELLPLAPMIKYNDVGNICNEHLEYYTYKSLKTLYEQNGLEIFKVQKGVLGNEAGSYRLFARHYRNGSVSFKERYNLRIFFKKIKESKKETVEFIKQQVAKGKKVYVYGASTKGNTILQYYGLDNSLILGAADKDPHKWGKYTIGTRIPIVSEVEARKHADYFFVLPWAFLGTFKRRERAWLKRGGKFILSIPRFQVIGI